jgi:hypothetical protein
MSLISADVAGSRYAAFCGAVGKKGFPEGSAVCMHCSADVGSMLAIVSNGGLRNRLLDPAPSGNFSTLDLGLQNKRLDSETCFIGSRVSEISADDLRINISKTTSPSIH